MRITLFLGGMIALLLNACSGFVGAPRSAGYSDAALPPPQRVDGSTPPPTGADPLTLTDALGNTVARRLTIAETRQSLVDILGVDMGSDLDVLPVDVRDPFDNNVAHQSPSSALIEGWNNVAGRLETKFATEAERNTLYGCTPTGAADEPCLRTFISRVGRRLLRRPLEAAEVDEFVVLAKPEAMSTGDFWVGAGMVLKALVQDPEFIYRVELGTDAGNGVYQLTAFEWAARVSYFLWGTAPDETLLDAAATGALDSSEGRTTQIARMVEDPRTIRQAQRFHALWLRYESIQVEASMATRLRRETDALVARTVSENRTWTEMLTSTDTFVDAPLATHYGLSSPAGEMGWVSYGDTGRRGILSHGSFLATGAKFGDTSPTRRGVIIRENLLCQDVPPPDPSTLVNVDQPPGDPNACKPERYSVHASGGCAGCHALIDPIGFGLERFGPTGAYRETEAGKPECSIEGEGEVTGIGEFSGPAELSMMLAGTGLVQACAVQQFYQFTLGRPLTASDQPMVQMLQHRFEEGYHWKDLLKLIAGSEAFRFRVERT